MLLRFIGLDNAWGLLNEPSQAQIDSQRDSLMGKRKKKSTSSNMDDTLSSLNTTSNANSKQTSKQSSKLSNTNAGRKSILGKDQLSESLDISSNLENTRSTIKSESCKFSRPQPTKFYIVFHDMFSRFDIWFFKTILKHFDFVIL